MQHSNTGVNAEPITVSRPLMRAGPRPHLIFPDCWTLSHGCLRWPIITPSLISSCCSQMKFVADQCLVSFTSIILLGSTSHSFLSGSHSPWLYAPPEIVHDFCCVLSPSRRHHRDALGMFSAIVPSLHRPVGTLGSFPCHWLQRYWTHCHLIWPLGIGVEAAIWPFTPSPQWEAWPKPSTLNGLPCIFLDFCIGLTPPSLNMVPCQPWGVSPNLGLDMYPDIYSTAFISAAQFTETRQAIRFLSLFQHPLCIKLHGQICFA